MRRIKYIFESLRINISIRFRLRILHAPNRIPERGKHSDGPNKVDECRQYFSLKALLSCEGDTLFIS